jgi:hypothetical protein
VREYSPKRRTAVVFTGSGTTGAYHAGVLRALDESGVKIDLVVGSGVGAVTAAFAAVGGGAKLYGRGGLWDGARWQSFYRLRPALRVALSLLGVSFAIIALPIALGLLLGIVFPLVLIADRVVPGAASRVLAALWVAPEALSGPYLAAQAVPVFALAMLAVAVLGVFYWRRRARLAEAFESFLDAEPGLRRVRQSLWEIARGAALTGAPGSEAELGRRYAALLAENLGEPGFRELILRVSDLDRGAPLAFELLRETEASHAHEDHDERVNLRAPGQAELFFDALATGLLLPVSMPLRRVTFPKGAVHAGETHRLADAALVPGCGIAEAMDAGAEQLVVVTGAPQEATPPPRRRGLLARIDATLRTLERQATAEIEATERANRMLSTLGHRTAGRGAWEDPESGHVAREVDLWVIRPRRRSLGPAELDGARDPATEVLRTVDDLVEKGFRDAYGQFIEPVVGQAPLPEREEGKYRDSQAVGL